MPGNDHAGLIVQPRDRRFFEELGVMRVIDREQAKIVAGFGSTTRVNARLLALTRAGLLRRFFLGTGTDASGGSRKALYALSEKSARLASVPYRGPRRKLDETLIADFFVEHQLTVNEIYCALKYREMPLAGVAFRRWIAFHEPVSQAVRLIPDGYVELVTPSGILASFLEVDLGHERGPVWKEKVKERRFGQSRFRVLVLANSDRRLHSLRKTVAAITQKVFWFASLAAVREKGILAPVWFRPLGDAPKPFIEERS